jgi:hypothetical protein
MWCMTTGLYIVFWDVDWYRYLWIFKGFRGAVFAVFWQDYQGLRLIKLSSKSLDITTFPEPWLLSINHRFSDIWFLIYDICKIRFVTQPQHVGHPIIDTL